MPAFRTRALEIHSDYVWDFDWVNKALRFVREHGLTSLVFHQNDIVDKLTYPAGIFAKGKNFANIHDRYRGIYRELYKYAARDRSVPNMRRDYLKRILELADRQGTEVWLENKELWFHDVFAELNPQIFKNGALCPNEPVWWDYINTKYEDLFSDIDGIAGIITAPATRESRLSISGHRCTCDLCKSSRPEDWYRRLLKTMYKPIKAAGKTLVVRDFVFDLKTQTEIATVMEEQPDDVIISLKNTPHDYYPTFPHNVRIGNVGNHRQWIEYDVMAQYYGWGIGPSHMVDDIRYRLDYALKHDVEGVLIRTDWEALQGHTTFHTPNVLNLYAAAALSNDNATSKREIYRDWLKGENYLNSNAGEADIDEAVAWSIELLGDSWEIVRRALYTNSCVFSDSSTFPVSLAHAWWLAEEKNSLRDWDPTKEHAMDADEPNVHRILAEKDEALRRVEALKDVIKHKPSALTDAAYENFVGRIEVFRRYVRGFREIGQACILTKYMTENNEKSAFREDARRMLGERLQGLLDLAAELRDYRKRTDHGFTTYIGLGSERLEVLHTDLTRLLCASASTNPVDQLTPS
ncbi:hypothetical protein SAMN04515648_3418 [Phyllobacterium sp. CL33Tsu]|uniref:hypothetical protein n=1 Tax=Phyllobacterium sp. CL33Tsu TaxID=1798191 RepID=UPI0008ECA112|nr:hypothetical protein [Phyllobacterium sp. CL33Tsu]SFJ28409.1 hypothetical protein SAMN04515648_3418 [Phyllobacterium sp. CL33Tsu]